MPCGSFAYVAVPYLFVWVCVAHLFTNVDEHGSFAYGVVVHLFVWCDRVCDSFVYKGQCVWLIVFMEEKDWKKTGKRATCLNMCKWPPHPA